MPDRVIFDLDASDGVPWRHMLDFFISDAS